MGYPYLVSSYYLEESDLIFLIQAVEVKYTKYYHKFLVTWSSTDLLANQSASSSRNVLDKISELLVGPYPPPAVGGGIRNPDPADRGHQDRKGSRNRRDLLRVPTVLLLSRNTLC